MRMRTRGQQRLVRDPERGAALIIALALVLALTVLVSATQIQVVQQLKQSKTERNYERALQMAEAGANAYANMLVNDIPAAGVANRELIPQPHSFPAVLTLEQFKQGVKNGTYTLVRYPPGSQQGYFAGHLGTPDVWTEILSYGWANGVVRRVRISAMTFSIFDWAAIWGINPRSSNQDYAWKFSGSANVVGACGGEGLLRIAPGANVQVFDGPLVWANRSYESPFSNPDLPIYQSAPNVPVGHPGTPDHIHPLASPLYRHFTRPLGFPTADQAANQASGTNQGTQYFRNRNDNATGIRLVVKNAATGALRELTGNYRVVPTTGNGAYQLTWPNSQFYAQNGMTAEEVPAGIRIYPGNYFFEAVNMQTSDVLYLRTFTDAEGADPGFPRDFAIQGPSANPNGKPGARDVRVYIGRRISGNDFNSAFTYQTYMEYPRYASRFRVYVAAKGTMIIKGTNQNPPPPFRVNLLAYNRDANGPYGNVQFQSSVYLYGSLIGWMVDVAGGTTIEKQVTELAPEDQLTYVALDWRELP